VHFHVLAFDGVFLEPEDEGARPEFVFLGDPSDHDVERLLATCRHRVIRLLARRGIHLGEDAVDEPADEDPELAATLKSSILDRERKRRRGARPPCARRFEKTRRLAHQDGFSLHADTMIPAHDHFRRQALVRYLLRPPFAPSQLSIDDDGSVRFRLSHAFNDGTTHFVWRPDAFLARLAALVPRPRRHLLTYHGVLAPNHRFRSAVVRRPRPTTKRADPGHARRRLSHHDLLLRVYGFFFRRCDHCGGEKRVLAVITHTPVVRAILGALGLDQEPPPLAEARAPPADLFAT